MISNDCATLVRPDFADLVLVGARSERRHHLHARHRRHGNGRHRLAEGGERFGLGQGEFLLGCKEGEGKSESIG